MSPDLAAHGGGLEAAGGGRRCWQRRPAGRLGIAASPALQVYRPIRVQALAVSFLKARPTQWVAVTILPRCCSVGLGLSRRHGGRAPVVVAASAPVVGVVASSPP